MCFVETKFTATTFCHPERGRPAAESKDPPKPETVAISTLSGEFGGSLDYGVAPLHLRSG